MRRIPVMGWLVILFVLAVAVIVSLNRLYSGSASPPQVEGTLTFSNSGQYQQDSDVGYNDVATLSMRNLPPPPTGMAYYGWLMPDQVDDDTVPLLLGRISNGGDTTLPYVSSSHTDLLAQYSGALITQESANQDPTTPSQDPNASLWSGWLPHTPTSGDPNQYSLLSHFRHLLAKDPKLQANGIPGGLLIWTQRNAGAVEASSNEAQGSWSSQMSDNNASLIHQDILRILDYIDGATYAEQDVPAGSPWLIDDPLAGKIGLLSYQEDQPLPGYLQHVRTHLSGIVISPGCTDEQKKVVTQAYTDIGRVITDLTTVRTDALQLVTLTNDQLRQQSTSTLLNEIAKLTIEVNSGWPDPTTGTDQGGAIWLNQRIQQLATISL